MSELPGHGQYPDTAFLPDVVDHADERVLLRGTCVLAHFAGSDSDTRGRLSRYAAFDAANTLGHDMERMKIAATRVNERLATGQFTELALKGNVYHYSRQGEIDSKTYQIEQSWRRMRPELKAALSGHNWPEYAETTNQLWPQQVIELMKDNTALTQDIQFIGRALIGKDIQNLERAQTAAGLGTESVFREAVLQNRSTGIMTFDRILHAMYTMAACDYFSPQLETVAGAWERQNPFSGFYPPDFIEDMRTAPSANRHLRRDAELGRQAWDNS
jgi:hypothetical protein